MKSRSALHQITERVEEHAFNATLGLPEYRHPFIEPGKQSKRDCEPLSGAFDGQLMEQCPTYRAAFAVLDIALGCFETKMTYPGSAAGQAKAFRDLAHPLCLHEDWL